MKNVIKPLGPQLSNPHEMNPGYAPAPLAQDVVTPLPWHTAENADVGDPAAVYAEDGEIVAEYCRPIDAAHIVRCVNAHDALVAALEAIAAQYSIGDARPNDLAMAMAEKARAALAAAK